MKGYFLSTLILLPCMLNAQVTFKKQFTAPPNTFVSTVLPTYDHGYIIMSTIGHGMNLSDTWLIKTNETGDILWSKTYAYGKPGFAKLGLVECPDSGFAVLGVKNGVYLLRLTKNGDSLWGKSVGSGFPFAIEISTHNEFIITGADSTLLFIRTNNNGDVLVHKDISIVPPGYSTPQCGYSIKPTDDNGTIIVGTSDWIMASYAFVVKTDYWGNVEWANPFTYLEMSRGSSIDVASDSGFVLAGNYSSGAFIIKTNYGGDTLWVNKLKSPTGPAYYSVITSNEGAYIACGRTGRDSLTMLEHILLSKTSQNGKLSWSKKLYTAHYLEGICVGQAYDDGFIILGNIKEYDTTSHYNIILVKTDANGNVTWIKNITSTPQYSVYPNPSSEYITIEKRQTILDESIEIFDMTGRCRIESKFEQGKNSQRISIGFLESGKYILKISTENQASWITKVLKN